MSRTSTTLPSLPQNGDEVTRDGVVYRYNSTRGEWETILSRNLTVVTKDTDQSYFTTDPNSATQTVTKKNGLLSVPDVDNNFINLKKSALALEREVQHLGEQTEADLTLKADISYVNAQNTDQNSDIIDNTTAINALNIRLGSTGDFGIFKDTTTTTLLGLANQVDATFSGNFTDLTATSTKRTSTLNGIDKSTEIPNTNWVQDYFSIIQSDITPGPGITSDLGTLTQAFRDLHITRSIIPAGLPTKTDITNDNIAHLQDPTNVASNQYTSVDLGSPTRQFNRIFAFDINLAGSTINLGPDTAISANAGGGVLLPTNSAIGNTNNTIPSTFASTLIDERFSKSSSNTKRLTSQFTCASNVTNGDPVKLNPDGTISPVTSSKVGFIGFAVQSAVAPEKAAIVVHGNVSGFSGLTPNNVVFLNEDGTTTQISSSSNEKIGVALNSTQIFLFTTSTIDTYILNKEKISFGELSVTNNNASAGGSLSYDNFGTFTFTPPDLTSFATTDFVNTQISGLVNSAPATLDTLNELAAALGNDDNFATTVTDSLSTKAPLANPTFTGSPTAPTPASTSNDTTIATTAFVKSQGGAQTIGGLTNVEINDLRNEQVLAFDSASQKFVNRNQSGGGSSVNFIVDGGTALSTTSDVVIFLDGGGA